MKKILSVFLVLCIAATLFAAAGVTVKVGSAFAFFNEKTVKDTEAYDTIVKFKGHGFGFDAEVQYDLSDKLVVFASYGKVFPGDVYEALDEDGHTGKWESWAESRKNVDERLNYKIRINFMTITAGAAYKFDFNAFKLAVGAGVSFNRLLAKATYTLKESALMVGYNEETRETLSNISVLGYAEAKYLVAENVGITLTAKPQMNIYSFYNYYCKYEGDSTPLDTKLKGVVLSFAMPVALGVSYSF